MNKNNKAKVKEAILAYEKAQELHSGTNEGGVTIHPERPEKTQKIRYLA